MRLAILLATSLSCLAVHGPARAQAPAKPAKATAPVQGPVAAPVIALPVGRRSPAAASHRCQSVTPWKKARVAREPYGIGQRVRHSAACGRRAWSGSV